MIQCNFRQLHKNTQDAEDDLIGAAAAGPVLNHSKDDSDIEEIDVSKDEQESSAPSFQASESDQSFEVDSLH